MFTPLERRVLDLISEAEHAAVPMLVKMLAEAEVISRENTGHGFYTTFGRPPSQAKRANRAEIIDGPIAHMENLGHGALMGFILWYSELTPSKLEGFQLGDSAGNTIDLKTRDLKTLCFSKVSY